MSPMADGNLVIFGGIWWIVGIFCENEGMVMLRRNEAEF